MVLLRVSASRGSRPRRWQLERRTPCSPVRSYAGIGARWSALGSRSSCPCPRLDVPLRTIGSRGALRQHDRRAAVGQCDVFEVVVFGHGIILMLSTDSMSGLVLVNPQANSVEKCRSPVSDSKMASILP